MVSPLYESVGLRMVQCAVGVPTSTLREEVLDLVGDKYILLSGTVWLG